ncbi:tetratricopeptide repeat protein [Streptomyces sp. NBC_01477]|uniref:tetratricopeptide repeat protein n=1 Tax=Streptomyces sp. NBC_01477 TaxID=2976015 RepID=UPI002E35264B|nr:tetratricopeptide repeat protein [Streptomyces sp. NBC_01477]
MGGTRLPGTEDLAERLLAEVSHLYVVAGSPPREALVRRCTEALGDRVSLSTVNPWLLGHSLPKSGSPVFLTLVGVLQQMAAERGAQVTKRSEGAWSQLLRNANDQRAAEKRGGRPRKKPPGAPRKPVSPRTLPADIADFTGRDAQVSELLGLLEPDAPAEVVLVAAGMAGVGKTTLAVHVADRARRAGWFSGGVLFVDLLGFSPDASLDAAGAAAVLLRDLGRRAAPPPAGERAGALRSLLAGRPPVLMVLDNAVSAKQLTGLVPHPPHRLLVTSRDTLSALPSARVVRLDSLSEQESVLMLDRALRQACPDDDRVTAEPGAARRIAELCGFLPLALRITAAQLRDDPYHSLADQAEALSQAHARLGLLSYDDVDADGRPLAVRAAFDLSFDRLADASQRAFRLIGALPGPDIGQETAAVGLDRSAQDTYRLLADLVRRHLLRRRPDSRWDTHDLLRLYAAEQVAPGEYEAALDRMLHHYRRRVPATCRSVSRDTGRAKDRRQAVEWLDTEHRAVAAAVVAACEHGRRREAVHLANDMSTYWEFRRLGREWTAAAEATLEAAHNLSAYEFAMASSNLGNAYRADDRSAKALPHLERAALLAPNELVRGKALHNLGLVQFQLGRYHDAASNHRADLDICRSQGDELGAAQALVALGDAQRKLGRHSEAADTLVTALSVLSTSRHGARGSRTDTQQNAHVNLALTLMDWNAVTYGNCGIWHLCHALRIALERGNRVSQLIILTNLAVLYLAVCPKCYAEPALDCAIRALALSEDGGDPVVAAGALLALGRAHLVQGDTAAGTAALRQAQEAYAAQGRPEATKIPSLLQETATEHITGCRGAGVTLWERTLHESVLDGQYDELERITFYGFRYVVWH